MRSFKFFWNTHKWTGILLSSVLATTAVTGFLLLLKKDFGWIQPPTSVGTEGEPGDFISFAALLEAASASGHPDFAELSDIDRIDVRPGKRVAKVRSAHNHSEVQIDLVTGAVLGAGVMRRNSDLIEQIHDGSFFGDAVHSWFMPAVSVGLLFMVCSGLWLWYEPKLRRRRRRRRRRLRETDHPSSKTPPRAR